MARTLFLDAFSDCSESAFPCGYPIIVLGRQWNIAVFLQAMK
jgi:hypothetical protein